MGHFSGKSQRNSCLRGKKKKKKWNEMMTKVPWMTTEDSKLCLSTEGWQLSVWEFSTRHPWMRLMGAKAASAGICDPVQHNIFINCYLHNLRQILIILRKERMRVVLCTYRSNVKAWKCVLLLLIQWQGGYRLSLLLFSPLLLWRPALIFFFPIDLYLLLPLRLI